MKEQLSAARTSRPFVLAEVDVDTDETLAERFGRSVPVLEIAGRVAFKGRLETAEFERKFERRLQEQPS